MKERRGLAGFQHDVTNRLDRCLELMQLPVSWPVFDDLNFMIVSYDRHTKLKNGPVRKGREGDIYAYERRVCRFVIMIMRGCEYFFLISYLSFYSIYSLLFSLGAGVRWRTLYIFLNIKGSPTVILSLSGNICFNGTNYVNVTTLLLQ